ncbi:ATPase AAA [Porphyromonas macacae]|uniref:ATPase AAA n=1 Tax=Porphyromonas macacae TaxID=28115 RepID=A0A0A2EAF7_9PORP|nr:AAA family ATPase [Porphyromonas macacae]KGN73409.1 ATPase AAA [Porphyromonas macacae]SUB88089.1 Uncharacterised protein [Porphyromonas macacae]
MDYFYRTHDYLLRNHKPLVRRQLMDRINWHDRLIGIKGPRGIGKTSFLLDYACENYGAGNRQCLYINLNQFYFTTETLVDFAGEFVREGGRVLLLDQLFKYSDWSAELRACMERYPQLQIIFSGSSVMRLTTENPELNGLVSVYTLPGFSLREYINIQRNLALPSFTLQQILENHQAIARDILKAVNPNDLLQDYMHHGYYPLFLEDANYSENLLKTINMTLEVDVLFIKQIEQRFLYKIRKLMYLLGLEAPATLNVSQLAGQIESSRATVMNYLKYLNDARLITLLYKPGTVQSSKKPARVYLDNTNLSYVMHPDVMVPENNLRTFFLNQLRYSGHHVDVGERAGVDFLLDGRLPFKVQEQPSMRLGAGCYYAVHNLFDGRSAEIPLWLFGFLY